MAISKENTLINQDINNSAMESDDEEKNNILKDMEEHGFPLEIKTSEVLESHSWETTSQASFLDSESGKSRTIDIIAEKNVILNSEYAFDIWLVVECKKTTKPWVFYARDLDLSREADRRMIVSSTQFSSIQSPKKKKSIDSMNLIVEKFFRDGLYRQQVFGKFAFNCFEPFTGGKHLAIHKARMQVCNAVLDIERMAETEGFPPLENAYFLFYIPMIVVDGRLYTFEKGRLSRAESLHYRMTYHGSSFIVEVVTAASFELQLSSLDQLMRDFNRQLGQIT